jgi:hypothetical protein
MLRSGLALVGLLVIAGLLWLMAIWPTARVPQVVASAVAGAPPIAEPAAVQPPEASGPRRRAPEPAAAASVETARPPALQRQAGEAFAAPAGPYAEYKTLFAREARGPAADSAERAIREAFEMEANGLSASWSCRQTVCRVELQWSKARSAEYVAAIGRLGVDFNPVFASAALGPSGKDQRRPVELFLKTGRSRPNPLAE